MSEQKILERVKKLLAQAESTNHPAERETYLAKADDLMTAHKIEMWRVEQAGEAERRDPVHVTETNFMDRKSPVKYALLRLVPEVARFTNVKYVWNGLHAPARYRTTIGIHWFGMPEDVEYAQTLLASLRIQMTHDLTPSAVPEADGGTVESNVVTLKESGMKWVEIYDELAAAGFEPYASTPHSYSGDVKLSKLYGRICERENRARMKTSPITYKRSFADGFVDVVNARLRDVRQRREAHLKDEGEADRFAVVLADDLSRADALIKRKMGKLSYRSVSEPGTVHIGAVGRGKTAGQRADIGLDRVGDQSRKRLGDGGGA